jgi:hypothetical protein
MKMALRRDTTPVVRIVLVMMLSLLSCTRMPTAPPTLVTVHGTITGLNGEPVPNIYVRFLPIDVALPDSLSDSYWARTETSGSFSVQLLTGSYEMQVLPPYDNSGWLGYSNRIQVTRDHALFDYAFHGFKVTGRLLDPEGVALTNGSIVAKIEADHPSYAESNVTNGQFSLVLPAGRYTISGDAAHFAAGYTAARLTSVPIGADTTFDIRLPGVPVTGTVVGPDGLPLDHAMVNGRSAFTLTDANGAYRLYLTEGPHAILCDPQTAGILPRQVVLAIQGPTTIDFDFRGVIWSGTVVTAGSNQPVAGCHVSLIMAGSGFDTYVHTDEQGAFRFVVPPYALCELDAYLHAETWTQIFHGFYRATTDTTFAMVAPASPSP